MKKYGLIMFLSFVCLLLLNSCTKEMIKDIKVSEAPKLNYKIGDDLENMSFNDGKITITYDSGRIEEKSIDTSWIKDFNFQTSTLSLEYMQIEHDYTYDDFFNRVTNSEELIQSTSRSGIYLIEEGTYEVDSLRYNHEVALIGLGNVVINVNSHVSSQAGIVFLDNTTLANIKINSKFSSETLRVNNVKVAKFDNPDNVDFIERFYAKNVYFEGGKGLNLMAVKNAKIDNCDILVNPQTPTVALSISCGTILELNESKVLNGTWGSIGIFGVDRASNKEWYKRKNELKVNDSNISSSVYIEYHEVSNSSVTGLNDFTENFEGHYKIFTKTEE